MRRAAITALTLLSSTASAFADDTTLSSEAPPSSAAPSPGGSIEPTRTLDLPNGLRVVISPQRDTARVAVVVAYDTGFRDQPEGYAGLPHIVEHAMFNGSRHVRRGEFFVHLERAGATYVNGFTSADRTEYVDVLPAEQLPLALWLESDRMAFMPDALDAAGLDQVRRTVGNEYLEGTGNVLAGLSHRLLFQSIYPAGHPYHSILDDESDIGAVSLDDVRWFWQRYYGPEHATLVIAGNVDATVAANLVEQYFGPIASHGTRTRRTPASLPVVEHRRAVHIEIPSRRGPVRVAWITPRSLEADDAALDVLADALLEAPRIGLRARLVTDGALAERVRAHQESMFDGSLFEIAVTPRPGAFIATVLPVIEAAVESVRRGELNEALVMSARHRYATARRLAWQDPVSRATSMVLFDSIEGTPDWIENEVSRYEAVDGAAVRRVAETWLSAQREITETIVPEVRAPIAGRLASNAAPSRGGSL